MVTDGSGEGGAIAVMTEAATASVAGDAGGDDGGGRDGSEGGAIARSRW